MVGPAGWHRWGSEAADTAQDTVNAWLRAHQTGESAAPPLRAAGSCCATHTSSSGREEASAQLCAALSRRRALEPVISDGRAPQHAWLQQQGTPDGGQSSDAESGWRQGAGDADAGGQMRPAMFAEKGCTTMMAAEHRHWLRLVRQHLQVRLLDFATLKTLSTMCAL